MNNLTETASLRRSLVCESCGTEFGCDLSGNCWCAEETAKLPMPKLPMPTTGGDCLCRNCLRAKAAATTAVDH